MKCIYLSALLHMYCMTASRVSCFGMKSCQLVRAKQDGSELVLRGKKKMPVRLLIVSEAAKEVRGLQPAPTGPTVSPLTCRNGQGSSLSVAGGDRLRQGSGQVDGSADPLHEAHPTVCLPSPGPGVFSAGDSHQLPLPRKGLKSFALSCPLP